MTSKIITGFEKLKPLEETDYAGWPSPFDSDGVQYAWDSTSLGMLKTCPRKYQLSMVLNWQPKAKSHHLLFGIYYHTSVEIYFKLRAVGVSHENSVRQAILRAMKDSFGYAPPENDKKANYKTRHNLIRTLVWYFEHYKNDGCTTVVLANGKPAVELSFRFEIGQGLILAGHLDRLIAYDGNLEDQYVQDHKTTTATITGASFGYYFKNYNPDNQMTLYYTAATVAFGARVKGVMIDAAQIAVGFSAFARDFTHRNPAALEEFVEGVHAYRRMAEIYTEADFFPMNESACGNYGGCEFREICSKAPQVRERFLRTSFTQSKPWNPLEPR